MVHRKTALCILHLKNKKALCFETQYYDAINDITAVWTITNNVNSKRIFQQKNLLVKNLRRMRTRTRKQTISLTTITTTMLTSCTALLSQYHRKHRITQQA